MLTLLTTPSQVNHRGIEEAFLGILCDKLENGVAALDYLDVSALSQYGLNNFVLLQPLAHNLVREVSGFGNFISLHVHVDRVFPGGCSSGSDVSVPLSFYYSIDH